MTSSNPRPPKKIRWPRPTGAPTKRWPRCNPGSPSTDSGMLVVATRGAVALPGEDVTDLAGAAVWGLVRSAQTEHPGRIVLVDSDAPLDDTTVAEVLAAGEPQVLVRAGTVHTARVHGSRAVDALLVPPSDGPWRIGMSSKGTFENLLLEPIPNADAPLEPGQVRVAVRTHGSQLPRRHDRSRAVPRRRCGDGCRGLRHRRRNRLGRWSFRRR